jgi:hypothetical protein
MTLAETGSEQSGAPATQPPPVENGSAAGTDQSPWNGLQDAGARSWVEKKGYKSVDDLAKAAHSLEGRLGGALNVPAGDAPAEEWEKFYAKAGRPEKPDGYELKRPEGLPEQLPYDEALAGEFKAWAHGAGLNGRQAQVLHDAFAKAQATRLEQQVAGLSKAVEETHSALVKEWGPQDSAGFKTKIEMANRALKRLGVLESFQRSGIILQDGALTDPALAKAFAAVGEKMFAEDKLDDGGAPGGDNPFREPRNITAISRLAKDDPETARRLAREAGVDPDQWVGKKRP